MNSIWNLTIDDYLEIVRISKERGIKAGESMQEVLEEYMNNKGQKPIGKTELTKEELIKEYNSHGKKVLDLS